MKKAVTYQLNIGYAYKSSRKNGTLGNNTVIVGEYERDNASFVGTRFDCQNKYYVFRLGRVYFFQLFAQQIELPHCEFNRNDIERDGEGDARMLRILADTDQLIDAPLWFHLQGLSETATGFAFIAHVLAIAGRHGSKRANLVASSLDNLCKLFSTFIRSGLLTGPFSLLYLV